MADTLTLFTSPSAFPNPQRLRIFLHEKGIADRFAETVYDMSPVGEQRGWRHLKMNPWGETPTLALADGSFLSETSAIARYLDDSFDVKRPGFRGGRLVWFMLPYRVPPLRHSSWSRPLPV